MENQRYVIRDYRYYYRYQEGGRNLFAWINSPCAPMVAKEPRFHVSAIATADTWAAVAAALCSVCEAFARLRADHTLVSVGTKDSAWFRARALGSRKVRLKITFITHVSVRRKRASTCISISQFPRNRIASCELLGQPQLGISDDERNNRCLNSRL